MLQEKFVGGSSQRGNRGGRNHETSESQDASWGPPRGRGRGGGHPPHLTGKAIGLYYRDQSKKKAARLRKKEEESCGMKLDPEIQEKVERMLEKTKPPYAPRLGNNETLDQDDSIGAKYTHIGDSQFKRKFIEIVSGNIQQNLSKALLVESKLNRNPSMDEKLMDEHRDRQNSSSYANMFKFRCKLPSFNMRHAILDLVAENQVVVISGETGKALAFSLRYVDCR